MKNIYRLIKALTFIFVCMLFLCGCTAKDTRTTIQFASWGSKSETDILKPILADFEKNNPDIKVDFMHIPQNYFQKIHLLFASNTAPDVLFINNLYLPVYANAGVLEELNIDNQSDFYPQATEAMTWNGKIYAIPRDISNLVIFYNKDLFDKKNVPYPNQNWTFEDFLQTAIKLTDKNTFGISFEENPYYYIPYLLSCGGDILPDKINTTESQYALNFYSDLRNKYHVAPKKYEIASATMAQMFTQQRIAMYLSGRWMVPKLREECKFDWDIVQFPKGTKGSIVQADSSGWAISKSSKHKDEAYKLIKYLSSKQSSDKFVSSGLIVPARIDGEKAFLDNKKPINAKVFIDIIPTSKPTAVTIDYREIIDNLQSNMEKKFN